MAYKKRYPKSNRRKTYRPRNNGAQTLNSVARVAGTALNIAKFVAGMINTEEKYHDVIGLATPGSATPFLIPLNLIAQGIDNTQRIGRSIKITYVNLKYSYFANAGISNQWVRCMVVQDLKHAGAIFPSSELLTQDDHLGQRNIDFGSKFKVLYDKTHFMVSTGWKTGGYADKYITGQKLASQHIEFDGVGAAISDISAFPLYLCIFSSNPGVSPPSVNYSTRVRYVDN